jgi:hypothetical protein
MAEQFLQDSQVGSAREKVSCEAVAECMWVKRLQESSSRAGFSHEIISQASRKGSIAKDPFALCCFGVSPKWLDLFPRLREVFSISKQRLGSKGRKRHSALFVAFTSNAEDSLFYIYLRPLE